MPEPVSDFKLRVMAYAHEIYKLTGRMPDYHTVAAEVAAADLRKEQEMNDGC